MNERLDRIDRYVDIVSVVLISLTSALSAVCIYQSARWTGEQTRLYNQASAYRSSATIAAGTNNAVRLLDISMFLRYLEAVHTGDTGAASFLFKRFRPEARPAIVAWLASDPMHNPKAAADPFAMPEYRLKSAAQLTSLETNSAAAFTGAGKANAISEEFLRLTIIFATVGFFGGISTKFRFPLHLIVVGLGSLALVYAVFTTLELPFR